MKTTGERIFIVGMAATFLALLGIAAYKISSNVSLLKKSVIKLVNLKLNTKSNTDWSVTFVFSFQNKSNIDIEVTGYAFDFKVNGIPIEGKVIGNTPQYIAANTTSNLNVEAAFNPSKILSGFMNPDFLKSLSGALAGGLDGLKSMDIGFALNGFVNAKHKGLSVQNIPVNYNVKLSDFTGTK